MSPAPSRLQRPYSFGPLYDFLMARFTDHRTVQGIFDIPRLAKDMGLSKEAAYRFMRKNKLSPEQATKLVALSKGRRAITYVDLIPFVFD